MKKIIKKKMRHGKLIDNEALRAAAEEAKTKLTASQQALLKITAAYKSYFGAASVGTDFATR